MISSQAISSHLSKIRAKAGAVRLPAWTVPLALLLVVVLAYGLRALSLGFFWDDWPYLWFFHVLGPQGISAAFSGDRPFLSFIYTISLTVLGTSARGWQIFALLAHWLCSLGLWLVLAQVWPRGIHKTAWVALLFAVYPGFSQHWIALIYGQAYLLFAALFFSQALTLWLARKVPAGKRRWLIPGTLLALSLSAFTMFSTEYFFGLELLRPVLLWVVLHAETRPEPARWQAFVRRAKRVLLWWAPYLALMAAFVIWRGVIHAFPGKSLVVVDGVNASPVATLVNLALTVVTDLFEAGPVAWGQTLLFGSLLDASPMVGLRALVLMLLTGLVTAAYLLLRPGQKARQDSAAQGISGWGKQALLVGGFALLAAGWPFWITGLPMRMGFPQDRYTLPLAVGVCLVLAGLIDWLLRDLPRKVLVTGALLALATGFHFNTALSYREDWNRFKDFYWQLTWRAPAIQANTLVVVEALPFLYYEDDSLTAPLNWTYAPDLAGQRRMPYLLYDLEVRKESLPVLAPNLPVERDFRATHFSGSTSQVLALHFTPSSCLHVLDPVYHAGIYPLPERLTRALPLSSPAQWISRASSPAAPPVELLGSEPRRRWCYYYQQAELARQVGDWKAIVQLAHDSLGEGYLPDDPAEYLPFIEGHARAGLWYDAYQLTRRTDERTHSLRPALCALWDRTLDGGEPVSDGHRDVLDWVDRDLHCRPR